MAVEPLYLPILLLFFSSVNRFITWSFFWANSHRVDALKFMIFVQQAGAWGWGSASAPLLF
jgi:hypothetical protein